MDTSPIFCVAKHPVILRDTAGRRVIVTLRLNSPRPFSSVSLATSPTDKGGIGVCAFACILIPSPFSPYCYRNFPQCYETRQGGGWGVFHFLPCFDFKCDTPQCYSCGNIRGVVRLKFECKGKKGDHKPILSKEEPYQTLFGVMIRLFLFRFSLAVTNCNFSERSF